MWNIDKTSGEAALYFFTNAWTIIFPILPACPMTHSENQSLISKSHYLAHTNPLFNNMMILKFYDLHTFQLLVFMYQTKHDLLPRSCLYSIPNISTGPYDFRKHRDFLSASYRTAMRKKHVSHAGPYAWHFLQDSLKLSDSLQTFKYCLKRYFYNLYN